MDDFLRDKSGSRMPCLPHGQTSAGSCPA